MNAPLPAPFAATSEKFRTLDVKSYMSIEDAHALSVELAQRYAALPVRPTCVVGLANGAIFTARIVADQLGVPLHIVLVRRRGSRIKQKLGAVKRALRIPSAVIDWPVLKPLVELFEGKTGTLDVAADDFAFDLADQVVALVDDCVVTGSSLRETAWRLQVAGARQVTSGVLCWYRGIGDSGAWEPDIHLHNFVHYYPWSSSSMHYPAFLRWISDHGLQLRD